MLARSLRWTRRRTITALSFAVLIPLVLVARPLVSYALVVSRSTGGFVPTPADGRVFFEPGAEAEAAAVAEALPGAVATVEEALGGPFNHPVNVYVCASPASFERFTGGDRASGTTLGGRLFLAPRLGATPERVPRVLAHELTHLYLSRREDAFAIHRILPPWFDEGLATWASGGGGAEGVGEDEAAQAIRQGRSIVPGLPTLWMRGGTASSFGLQTHMFYRQSAMFVGYLHDRDPAAFGRMIRALEAGEPLARALPAAFGAGLAAVWDDFVGKLAGR